VASHGEAPSPHIAAWAFLVDFDGTITDLDTFDVLVRRFASDAVFHETERGLRHGSVTLRDVMQHQASFVRGTFDEVAALLAREVAIDPTFRPFVERCRAHDIPVTIVSSGIEPIVRGRMAEIGLDDLPIIANGIDANPSGWRILYRDAAGNGTDKVAVVHAAQVEGRRVAFVGDGRSDYAAALAADRCFAKRDKNLAHYLNERGAPYEAFTSFAEIDPASLL
jgi:2,3-diketo-5-methylthio-1-phosphopentane phosphatase